jgi:hypothetical protein
VTSAALWIALATALVSRDGCGDAPTPTTGSGAPSAGSAATAPTLAPSAAPPAGSTGSAAPAAPTKTTITPEAQAKLDKLVGARPGTHKLIKPTPEPTPAAGAGSGSGSGSAAAKLAKPRNKFPEFGREMGSAR